MQFANHKAPSTRREFLKRVGVGASALLSMPHIVPSFVLGANAPSNRIAMGCIGVGGMGTNNMRGFMANPDVQVLAVCDAVTGSREYGHWYKNGWQGDNLGREPARMIVDDYYAQKKISGRFEGCSAYVDFRELLAREDIDAVSIATPDHWHAVISILAAQAGKHIYCEKPLSLAIAEGRAMAEAVRRYGVVFQTGSHERSSYATRFGCELVRNGRIGELKKIRITVGPNNKTAPSSDWQPMPIPEGFDYNMWLGPAPWAPYHKDRCLYNFRFILDYSGGQTTNFGAHCIDMAQWGNNTDHTGPIEVEDIGGEFPQDGLFDTATKVAFRASYANGVELTCETGKYGVQARFEGTHGSVEMGYGGFRTSPESLKTSVIGPNEIRLYKSDNHHRNFLDCIKSGHEPVAPVEVGHRSVTICHLGNIAMTLKRKLCWNPENERFVGDDQANRMLSKPMRSPWRC